jgi:hypothetical protein
MWIICVWMSGGVKGEYMKDGKNRAGDRTILPTHTRYTTHTHTHTHTHKGEEEEGA